MTDEHTRIEELLSAMQDDAATPEDTALVERHLATCARCRATASAFAQVDREVRRYLMATPVPEIAAPWRAEPLLAASARPRTSSGHWRITTVGLALVFVLLLAGTALTFFTMRDTGRDVALTTGGSTAIAAQAALPTPSRESSAAFAAPASAAASAAASSAASARAASGAAASAAPSAAAAAAAAPSARPRRGHPPLLRPRPPRHRPPQVAQQPPLRRRRRLPPRPPRPSSRRVPRWRRSAHLPRRRPARSTMVRRSTRCRVTDWTPRRR